MAREELVVITLLLHQEVDHVDVKEMLIWACCWRRRVDETTAVESAD
jgi:hypothetical protein